MHVDDAPGEVRAASPRTGRLHGLVAVAAIAGPALAVAGAAWTTRWTSDDGFINYRIVDQIAHGNGPVFNAGERVEAGTSTLWIVVLATARLLTPGSVELEWIGLVLALVATLFGVVAAGLVARRIAEHAFGPATAVDPVPWLLPFGTLFVVALPPFWHFATSGLENGLGFAWLGGCFWMSTAFVLGSDGRRSRRLLLGVLLGLGVLVRPDFGLFSLTFVAAIALADEGARIRDRVAFLAAVVALPLAYQVFRMGYYGVVVPNTAIAKSADSIRWGDGVHYLWNFVRPYGLYVPFIVLVVVLAYTGRALLRRGERRLAVVAAAPVVGGLLHATYVVAIGGDFMHARMLLSALFATMMPVAVVLVSRRLLVAGVAVFTVWTFVSVIALRAPWGDGVIDDEHRTYAMQSGNAHPVTLADYRRAPWLAPAARARRDAARGRRMVEVPEAGVFFLPTKDVARRFPLRRDVHAGAATVVARVGAAAYAAGTDVFVLDRYGLADPIGSRLEADASTKPGHERWVSIPWVEARLAAGSYADPDPIRAAGAAFGRVAMGCGALADLLHATRSKLTFDRFVDNLTSAKTLTDLRIPDNPDRAVARFCRRR